MCYNLEQRSTIETVNHVTEYSNERKAAVRTERLQKNLAFVMYKVKPVITCESFNSRMPVENTDS